MPKTRTMTGYSLKLKTKKGQHVVNNIDSETTVGDLKKKISDITEIPETFIHILIGFPPKPLDLSNDGENIKTIGITSGDTLIIEEKINNATKADAQLAQSIAAEEQGSAFDNAPTRSASAEYVGVLLKRVVPADNSCLFTSVGFVLNGKVDTDCSIYMRKIIAEHVRNDPVTYNEGILGKPNKDYCEWIQRSESWGGAIEVSILSIFYGMEIDVVDIQNAIINRFGEDKNYGTRVFLLFDGIHYDPLYLESTLGGAKKTVFPIEEFSVYQQAEQLAIDAKSSRQYTNVEKFSLCCLDCNELLVGQDQAQKHAKSTGHTNFGEV